MPGAGGGVDGGPEPVGQGRRHDGRIVIAGVSEAFGDLELAMARRHGERPDIVPARLGDEVRQGQIGLAVRLLDLLTQGVEASDLGGAGLVGIDGDVVADGVGRPEADHALGGEPCLVDDPLQHRPGVLEQVARGRTDDLVVEDQRIAADQLPAGEEGCPVDVIGQVLKIPAVERPDPDEGRRAGHPVGRIGPEPVLARLGQGGAGLDLLAARILFADADVFVAGDRLILRPLGFGKQT